jgi:catechol 2,3-dioxygenase-like lactoylglutathione lyase family enzyme
LEREPNIKLTERKGENMNEKATDSLTQGVHHIGLTVPNLEETNDFFVDTLGFKQIGEVPDYPATFLSDGNIMITLWQAEDAANATPFDRKNVIGLHHLALIVEDQAALDAMHDRLQSAEGTSIEFAPEPLGDGPTRHMMCNIPSGIRVEFIAPAS